MATLLRLSFLDNLIYSMSMVNQETARYVVGCVFCTVPFVFYVHLIYLYNYYKKRTPTGFTHGVISKIGVERASIAKYCNRVYTGLVEYEYVVNGKQYASSAIGLIDIYGLQFFAKLALRKYHIGDDVIIFYDPKNPGHAVLKPTSWKMLIFLMLIFLSIGQALGILIITRLI